MTEYVFKRKRKKGGKVVSDQVYTGRYKLAGDVVCTTVNLGVTDKQVAVHKLREIVKNEERSRCGLGVSKAENDCMNAPVADLLEMFIAELECLGRSSDYTRHVSARVLSLIKACGWVRLRDVNSESFRQWRKGKSASVKTLNEYQNAIVALLNWVKKTKGVNVTAFDSVEHISARGRQSFERRALSVHEASALLASAPLKRRVAYAFALFTGLRRGEIAALEWRDIHLDEHQPFVSVRASTTKNGKPATIPMHPDLVSIVTEWRGSGVDTDGLFLPRGVPENEHGLWHDLKAAGIVRVDESGRRVDFHSLRHTTCTLLQVAGVPSRIVMEIMRHSDIRLTNKVYTDAGALPTGEAISKIPSLLLPATGTLIGTHYSVSKGQAVSHVVLPKNKTPDSQLVADQTVVTDCHGASSSGNSANMVLGGGLEPPRLSAYAPQTYVSAIPPPEQRKRRVLYTIRPDDGKCNRLKIGNRLMPSIGHRSE